MRHTLTAPTPLVVSASAGPWRSTAVSTAAVVGLLTALQLSPYTAGVQRASDLLQLLLAGTATAFAVHAAGRGQGRARLFWAMVAGAAGSWTCGQLLFTLEQSALVPLHASGPQRGLFLVSAFPLAVAGLLRPHRAGSRASLVILNVALVAAATLFFYFYVGVSFAAEERGFAEWRRAASVAMLAVATVTVFPLAFVSESAWRPTYRLLVAATVLWFGGNAVVAIHMLTGGYRAGLLDIPWAVPFAWLSVCAWRWRPSGEQTPVEAAEPWRDTRRGLTLALLSVAVVPMVHVVAGLVIDMPAADWRERSWLTLVALLALTVLFGVRQHQVAQDAERTAADRARETARMDLRFSQAFAQSPAAMLIVAPDGRLVDVNAHAARLLEHSRDALVGRPLDALVIRADSATDPLRRACASVQAIGNVPLTFHTRAGTTVEALVSVEPIEAEGERRLLLLFEDVGERRGLEAELRSATRMESVGRLAAGIAHEFNNLLTAITNAGALALADVTHPEAVTPHLDHIDRASERAATLTRQLLAFGRRQALKPEPLDLGRVVDEMSRLLPPTLGEHIRLFVDVPPGLPRVHADRAQMQQVLLHLAANARDAMPQGGNLSIRLGAAVGPAGAPMVALTVADDGTGMSEAVQQHLFEPFFTTKELAAGGGLGLPAVYGIVTQSGGRIDVDSEPGRGTTVRILLPALEESAPRAESRA